MADPQLLLVDRMDKLTEALLTLAAVEIALRENPLPDQAASRVAHQRHELRHALARWRPAADSYRAVDLD
jgi:hypothetical protein